MTDPTLLTHETAKEAFFDAFRSRVGFGAGKISKADLADKIEVTPSAIKSWFDGVSIPQHTQMMKLYAFFGPAFTCEVLHPSGLGGVNKIELADVDPNGIAADLSEETYSILQRLRDGRFCHRDRAITGQELIELATKIEAQGLAMKTGAA